MPDGTEPVSGALTRLERFIDRGPGDACWPWTGAVDNDGYPLFQLLARQTVRAQRWYYTQMVGPIPAGHVIRHRCDNPPCMNYVKCLHTGTVAQNNDDRRARGRGAVGERHPRHVLTSVDVTAIRALAAKTGRGSRYVAKRLALSRNAVEGVMRGTTWRHQA